MEALRKKWKSSRGASILMALLFLLVCMMVGASVLMAAVSNAGKLKSNREEQQKYLTLSSALTLICDELEDVEYVGRYDYSRSEVNRPEIDDEGNSIQVLDHYKHSYTIKPGELSKNGSEWSLKEVLPLYHDLDLIFRDNFKADPQNPRDEYEYTLFPDSEISAWPKSPHTVTLRASADADLYGGLTDVAAINDEVTIKAVLDAEGEITLTATFGTDNSYSSRAILKPNDKLKKLLVLGSSGETQGVKWTLDRIEKEEG